MPLQRAVVPVSLRLMGLPRTIGCLGYTLKSLSKRSFASFSESTIVLDHLDMQSLAQIADQVKVDVLSMTMIADNAARRRHVSRSFICESYYKLLASVMRLSSAYPSGYHHRSLAPYFTFRVAADLLNATPVPSEDMYAYAVQASLGDDVYEAEPSTNALEEHIAKLTGKEAALFVASGTMSNQLALRTHLKQPPYSVLADHRSHIHKWVYIQRYARILFS